VDDETYQREVAVLSIGLENARRELNAIKEAMDKLETSAALKRQRGILKRKLLKN